MHVVFVEPAFPDGQRQFVRALQEVGARVTGIGERPLEALDPELVGWLYAYHRIGNVCDENGLAGVLEEIRLRDPVDRLEATIEAHILPVARVRQRCGLPGTTERTAFLCRDKPAMKRALREAGVPCAQSTSAATVDEIREFARDVGYPIIVKPRDAAGASGTHRLDSAEELDAVTPVLGLGGGDSVAVEEFVQGHEGFYDTLCIDGRVVHEFISHYYPNVLEAMRERWISPQWITTNRLDSEGYAELRDLAGRVIELLGIETSATHMEWFFGPKGLRFSEIGCRPPGVNTWDVYCAANEFDLYREWASGVVHGRSDHAPSRRYCGGMIALRPSQDGVISGYESLDWLYDRYGEWIIDAHFPETGTPTQPVEAGFMANAWVRLKHPDYDHLRSMMDDIGHMVRVRTH